ncbi:MAG: hypothetical protein ABL962_10790 [Fimbriimonadaceae bacterium]
MNRPSKKEIKAAVDKLKDNPNSAARPNEPAISKLAEKKSSQRIRKQGV